MLLGPESAALAEAATADTSGPASPRKRAKIAAACCGPEVVSAALCMARLPRLDLARSLCAANCLNGCSEEDAGLHLLVRELDGSETSKCD